MRKTVTWLILPLVTWTVIFCGIWGKTIPSDEGLLKMNHNETLYKPVFKEQNSGKLCKNKTKIAECAEETFQTCEVSEENGKENCTCKIGYEEDGTGSGGLTCKRKLCKNKTKIAECADKPFQTCEVSEENGEENCTCKTGYEEDGTGSSGLTCKINTPCDPNPCDNTTTTCIADGTTNYYCKCKDGYKLKPYNREKTNEEECLVNTPCDPNPCDNTTTTCIADGTTNYYCKCKDGYKLKPYNREKTNKEECLAKTGCEGGGRYFCFMNGAHWVCKDDTNQPQRYRCECEEGYKEAFGKCIEKTGCKEVGRDVCSENGDHWVCKDDERQPKRYRCECEKGYRDSYGWCKEISGCGDSGGVNCCRNKGAHWICKNDKMQPGTYRCECEKGYKDVIGKCIEKAGCEDLGGNDECRTKGYHWTCKNDRNTSKKYKCVCEENFTDINGRCTEKVGCREVGNNFCSRNGAHWVCKEDANQPRKFRCEYEKGYMEEIGARKATAETSYVTTSIGYTT